MRLSTSHWSFRRGILSSLALCLLLALAFPPDAHGLTSGTAASLVLGQAGFTSNTPTTGPAGFNYPSSVAIDPVTGKVFVADLSNNRVLRFAGYSALRNGASAEAVLGQPSLYTAISGCDRTIFRNPFGVAADAHGRLWVSDTGNNRVLRFDNAANLASGAGANAVLGQKDFSTCTLPLGPSASSLSGPYGLAVDAAGRLWVADLLANRVVRFDNAVDKANGAEADGVLGQSRFNSSSYPASTTADTFRSAANLALNSDGTLWVADNSNNRVLRFANAASKPNGAPADSVIGQANLTSNTPGSNQARLRGAAAVAVDPSSGRVWVADAYNNRVLWFDAYASMFNGPGATGVLGQSSFTDTGSGVSAKNLSLPFGVTFDPIHAAVWVADYQNQRVLAFVPRGGRPATLVLGQSNFLSNNQPIAPAGLQPSSVAVDPVSGKVFVADLRNNRVLRFASYSALSSGATAEAVLGQPDFTSNTPGCSRTTFDYVSGVAVDHSGHLWVSESTNHRVLRFDGAASLPNGAPAAGVLGQPDFSSCGIPPFDVSASIIGTPFDLAVDTDGHLWVADLGINRVLRFDNAAGKPNGAPADGVLGQPDFTSRTYPSSASQSTFRSAPYLTVSGGTLWVADQGNNRVLRFDSAAGKPNGAPADGVLGQPDFTSNTAGAGNRGLRGPKGLAVEQPGGRLYIADYNNHRVLWFDAAASRPNGAPADGVLGQPDLTSTGCGTSAVNLCWASNVAYDPVLAVLWVADYGNYRLLAFGPQNPPAPTATPTPTPTAIPTPTSPAGTPVPSLGLNRTDKAAYNTKSA